MNDDPFLVSKNGEVWACWLDGKPAVNLGSEQNFWMVAEKLFNELHPVIQPAQNPGKGAGRTNEPLNGSPAQQAVQIDRDEPRYDVSVIGRLYGSSGSREVTIFDLSTRGCRVQDLTSTRPGSLVTVKIGTVGPIGGVIRWRRDNFIGIMFENPLYPAVLDNIRQEQSLR
ncbi:PilZ domain-containing protein [Aurantiacibacter rhizosphaerae]|uniref:PilZ domain-containing protein n=1 Tax=Aurantiacibacter rhizosphaerae TaxID=2691582 RepID=A0A844X9J8_9SPHN|nr:PilZ domain-containing protein [Aurantiacibacter rhizosphaerae]MWV27017.1 hypothetical protein [Aurantiacibacter rhizosphaerae]